MMTKKVMVTGAGGYIGTQLVRDLVKLGHEVTAVDRFFFGVETLNEFVNNKNVKILKKHILLELLLMQFCSWTAYLKVVFPKK